MRVMVVIYSRNIITCWLRVKTFNKSERFYPSALVPPLSDAARCDALPLGLSELDPGTASRSSGPTGARSPGTPSPIAHAIAQGPRAARRPGRRRRRSAPWTPASTGLWSPMRWARGQPVGAAPFHTSPFRPRSRAGGRPKASGPSGCEGRERPPSKPMRPGARVQGTPGRAGPPSNSGVLPGAEPQRPGTVGAPEARSWPG